MNDFIPPLADLISFYALAIGGSIDRLIEAYAREMGGPMLLALTLWWIVQAFRFFSGDVGQEGAVLLRRATAMTLLAGFALSAPLLIQYVKGALWHGVANWLTGVASRAGLSTGRTSGAEALGLTVPGGTNYGADLEVVLAHAWKAVAPVWEAASFYDVLAMTICALTLIGAYLQVALAICSFIVADFLAGALIGLAAPFLALALFDYTRPYFDRWLGKIIALILVKLIVVVLTQMVIQSNVVLLETIRTGTGALQQFRVLLWVFIVFAVGTLVLMGSAAIAYSIGGGGGVGMAFMPGLPRGGGGGGRGGLIQSMSSAIRQGVARAFSGQASQGGNPAGGGGGGAPGGGRPRPGGGGGGGGGGRAAGGPPPARPVAFGNNMTGVGRRSAPGRPRPMGSP